MIKLIAVKKFAAHYVVLVLLLSSQSEVTRNNRDDSTEDCTLERNRVERLINRLKQYRRIATRYEKYAVNYLAMLMIGAIRLWL